MNVKEIKEFRRSYRETAIPTYYSPWFHVIFNFGSTTLLFVFFMFQVQHFALWQFLVLIPAFLLANLVEYLLHRFPLHRPYPGLYKYTFVVHQEDHHHFYTDDLIVYDEPRDWIILFFHPALVIILAFGVMPFLYVTMKMVLSPDLMYLMMAGAVLYFIVYEVTHYICHLPDEHWVLRIKYFKLMRKHHMIHHNLTMMTTTNFNIVFPFWDWVFRTLTFEYPEGKRASIPDSREID